MAIICPECKSKNSVYCGFCKICGTQVEKTENDSSKTDKIINLSLDSAEENLYAGRYRILSSLGQGGMGEVYKVYDTTLQEEMALKFLKTDITSNPVFIKRFRNELKLARKITHRNVCRVFDFHEEAGVPFFTMEYVAGENLKSLIKKNGKFKEAEAINIVTQIAAGLAEAHGLGVVHRDLKPQNIQIEPSGRAKIMDFGIARSVQETTLTQPGCIIGTPDYMSPEQAAGQSVDHRSDIYALGVLLYEMTTGQLPFKGKSELEVILQHREKAPTDPRKINSEISIGLSSVILCCIEKKRDLRYSSAMELIEDLCHLSHSTEKKMATKKIVWRFPRNKEKITAISAVIIVLIAVVVFLMVPLEREPYTGFKSERPSLAVLYFENNTGDESLAHWRKGFAELLITDLSQSKYLNVLSGDRVYKILDKLGQLDTAGYSSDVLKLVAKKANVRHVLRGSYIRAGTRFRVSISMQDMKTGELIGSRTEEADNEESLFTLVDKLTRRIKTDLNLTSAQIANDIDKEMVEVTTSSPKAYKLFVEGLRQNYIGNYQSCIQFMNKAIATDPEFAMAYAWKAWCYQNMTYHKEFVTALTKAFQFRHKASERERFRFTAYYYMFVINDIPRAKEELLRFVGLYPDDIYANHQLGVLYRHHLEDYDKSIQYFKHNVENKVEMVYSYAGLALSEMNLGNYQKAENTCEHYLSEFGDHPTIRFIMSGNHLCSGDFDQALVEAENSFKLGFPKSEYLWIKGVILQTKGDLITAEDCSRQLVDTKTVIHNVFGNEFLGLLALLQGRYQKARTIYLQTIKLAKETGEDAEMSMLYLNLAYTSFQTGDHKVALDACAEAVKYGGKSRYPINVAKFALHLKGLCLLALKNSSAAINVAKQLKVLEQSGFRRSRMKDYFHLNGSIEMEQGNYNDAVKNFEKATALLYSQALEDGDLMRRFPRSIFLFYLAKAYYQSGSMLRSKDVFKKLTGLTVGRFYWGDLYVKSYYWLGKISEEQGKSEEAAKHYRTFLNLWENADSGIPEIKDARKRLYQ